MPGFLIAEGVDAGDGAYQPGGVAVFLGLVLDVDLPFFAASEGK
jgi:hypothetical protein